MSKTKQSIEQFLVNAQKRNLKVRGNTEDLWFAVDGIKLDSRFNVPETSVMIRFKENSNDPIILIPEEVSIRPDTAISDKFIESSSHIEGWHSVFSNLFLDVDGEIIELLFSISGVLANLSLYNLVS
ncbi:MAG: hypothetical protein KAR47_17180, partial [Planctomycetes bacterium]|nr:hypothetical protein [Planctomycetota bacterium]